MIKSWEMFENEVKIVMVTGNENVNIILIVVASKLIYAK